jgi:hypothetical protein
MLSINRDTAWQLNPFMPLYIGRRLQFPPDTKLSQAAFGFVQIHFRASFRSNAILWLDGMKIEKGPTSKECLIEMSTGRESIDIVVRGPKDSTVECQEFLQICLTNVQESLKQINCGSGVKMSYLSPTQLASQQHEPVGYLEHQIADALSSGEQCVKLSTGMSDSLCDLFLSHEERNSLLTCDGKQDECISDSQITLSAQNIASNWQAISTFLQPQPLMQYEISRIEQRHPDKVKQANAMLQQWKKRHKSLATWGRLQQAIQAVKTNDL